MQKRHPLGVTILATWALVGSGLMFVYAVISLAQYQGIIIYVFKIVYSEATVPLGSTYVDYFSNGYVALAFAWFYVIADVYTFRGSKGAGFANIGVSIAALPILAFMSSLWAYNELNGSMTHYLGLSHSETKATQIAGLVASISLIALRLHYLIRPDVRDFFDTKLLFAQKRTA